MTLGDLLNACGWFERGLTSQARTARLVLYVLVRAELSEVDAKTWLARFRTVKEA